MGGGRYQLAGKIPWGDFEEEFGAFYSKERRPAKLVRPMVGPLILKQLHDHGDETVVEAWRENPYCTVESIISCSDQFICLAFGQLTFRDLEPGLRSRPEHLYHLGLRGRVCRSTLAEANEQRDWRIYADVAAVYRSRRRYTPKSICAEAFV